MKIDLCCGVKRGTETLLGHFDVFIMFFFLCFLSHLFLQTPHPSATLGNSLFQIKKKKFSVINKLSMSRTVLPVNEYAGLNRLVSGLK